MIADVCQRWRDGRATYRPAREVVDVRRLEIAAIASDAAARAFVERHHYEHSYPAARFRFGLYERGALVGVGVFSQPVNDRTLAVLPGAGLERTELGRLVLLDHVGANAETWFLGQCFEALRAEGIVGVVSFSDPMERRARDGSIVTPGHVGTIYQAHNAVYLGRSKAERRLLLPDGTIVHNRALAKVRARDRGYLSTVARLVRFGAEPLAAGDDARAWLAASIATIARSVPHPGNHKYAWALRRRDRKHLPASLAYPKVARQSSREAVAA